LALLPYFANLPHNSTFLNFFCLLREKPLFVLAIPTYHFVEIKNNTLKVKNCEEEKKTKKKKPNAPVTC